MTDADADALGGHEVSSAATVDAGGAPVPGGLFDFSLFGGPEGKGWGFVRLDEPLPSPVMEDPIRALLGLTSKAYRDVLAGREKLGGRTGPAAVGAALEGLDLARAEEEAMREVRGGRRSARDAAVKRLRAARGLKSSGLGPGDLMVSKIPVLPPAYRPATKMGNVTVVADANHLYRYLIEARDLARSARERFGEDAARDEGLAAYDALRALQGYGDPVARAVSPRDAALGNLSKVLRDSFEDMSVTWGHASPGRVVDPVAGRGRTEVGCPGGRRAEAFRRVSSKSMRLPKAASAPARESALAKSGPSLQVAFELGRSEAEPVRATWRRGQLFALPKLPRRIPDPPAAAGRSGTRGRGLGSVPPSFRSGRSAALSHRRSRVHRRPCDPGCSSGHPTCIRA